MVAAALPAAVTIARRSASVDAGRARENGGAPIGSSCGVAEGRWAQRLGQRSGPVCLYRMKLAPCLDWATSDDRGRTAKRDEVCGRLNPTTTTTLHLSSTSPPLQKTADVPSTQRRSPPPTSTDPPSRPCLQPAVQATSAASSPCPRAHAILVLLRAEVRLLPLPSSPHRLSEARPSRSVARSGPGLARAPSDAPAAESGALADELAFAPCQADRPSPPRQCPAQLTTA